MDKLLKGLPGKPGKGAKINVKPKGNSVSNADVETVRRSLMGKTNVKPKGNSVSNADVETVRRSLMGKTNVKPKLKGGM